MQSEQDAHHKTDEPTLESARSEPRTPPKAVCEALPYLPFYSVEHFCDNARIAIRKPQRKAVSHERSSRARTARLFLCSSAPFVCAILRWPPRRGCLHGPDGLGRGAARGARKQPPNGPAAT